MSKINRSFLHEEVLKKLRKRIIDGDFKPGESITQNQIAEYLGVSRMPVREAFSTLNKEGLIQILETGRVVVIGLTIEHINDNYDIRGLLEGLAAKKAALSGCYKEELKATHNLLITAESSDYVELNRRFHNQIWKASDSQKLIGLLESLNDEISLQFPELADDQIKKSIDEHKEIMNAILKGDGEQAFASMVKHIKRSKKDFLKYFDEHQKR